MSRVTARFIVFGVNFDQVNAQLLPANYTPVNYTPVQVGTEGTNKVSAHLKGIDQSFLPLAGGTMTGVIKIPAGSVTAPSIAVVGSLTTGIYSAAANTISLTANGTLALTATSTSVTTALPILTPAGTAAAPSHAFSTDAASGLFSVSSSIVGLSSGGVESLRSDSAQRIGIGAAAYGSALSHKLMVFASGATSDLCARITYVGNADPSQPALIFTYARGTYAAPTAAQAGDNLGSLSARPANTTSIAQANLATDCAQINFVADENFTLTAGGAHISFLSTATGTQTLAEQLRVQGDGTIRSFTRLRQNSSVTDTTFTTLASATLTLTNTSTTNQYFSGSTAGQIVALPSATTLQIGQQYNLFNSGTATIQVKDGSGTNIGVVPVLGNALLVCVNVGSTAGIWMVSTDFNPTSYEVSATATTTTTSATDAVMTGMTVTPTAGTYQVVFTTWLTQSAVNTVNVSIYSGGTQKADSLRTISPDPGGVGSTNMSVQAATNGIVTVNGSQAVAIEWSTAGGTATAHQRTMNLVRVG